MFQQFLAEIATTHFWIALLGIIFVDILLSGDNALVISAVTSKLPKNQQRAGVFIGSALAVGLRIVLAFFASYILSTRGFALAGGLYLIKVAYDLVKLEEVDEGGHKQAASLWGAIVTIGLVDVSMSLDNVLAIASMAHGSMLLMALGVALSIPMVIGFSLLINYLLERYPGLKWAGAIFLAVIAGKVIAHDGFVVDLFPVAGGSLTYMLAAFSAFLVLSLAAISRIGATTRQLSSL